ncbi:hypothetical protein [Clostridium sp. KNHs214]|uniref:hypothetical protein n=1 Tax=Clostridium sp. KNHs214 TaxID=1540257 RepID=UPI0005598B0E|nr:hypothetical protein [Clostridium sp. KNHs214]
MCAEVTDGAIKTGYLDAQGLFVSIIVGIMDFLAFSSVLIGKTTNPLIPSVHIAKKILDDYIEANKGYFPELK